MAEAKRLLAAAGHPNGFPASICFATYGSTQLVDHMQLVIKQLKDVGIDARLDQKEYGAYQGLVPPRQVRLHGLPPPHALPRAG